MRTFQAFNESWAVRTTGTNHDFNPVKYRVDFWRVENGREMALPGDVTFISGGLESVSDDDLRLALQEALERQRVRF